MIFVMMKKTVNEQNQRLWQTWDKINNRVELIEKKL
jgi:hypothetical protein